MKAVHSAGMAQLAARLPCKQHVAGSIPAVGCQIFQKGGSDMGAKDRLYALWDAANNNLRSHGGTGIRWRLKPARPYGIEGSTPSGSIMHL